MKINQKDMSIIESGWYKIDIRVGDMKDHSHKKNFKWQDVFLD